MSEAMPGNTNNSEGISRRALLRGGAAMAGAMVLGFDSYSSGVEAAEKKATFMNSVKAAYADEKNEIKKTLNMAIKENEPKIKTVNGSWEDVDATGKKVTITSMTFTFALDEEFGVITTIGFKGKREGSDKSELLGSSTMKAKKEERAK